MPVRLAHERDLGRAMGEDVEGERLAISLSQEGQVVDDLRERAIVGERPVVEVDRDHLVTLPKEIVEGNRRVDPPAHEHHAARHAGWMRGPVIKRPPQGAAPGFPGDARK